MNPEVKKLWLEALRSGEYKKGICTLQCNDEFCCLGVLCDLAVKRGIIAPPKENPYGKMEYNGNASDMPQEVYDWAGLQKGSEPTLGVGPKVVVRGKSIGISIVNDSYENSFSPIADIIEAQL